MQRVIKFSNQYKSDKGQFSTCSTKYTILPILVGDDAGAKELKEIAAKLGIDTKPMVEVGAKAIVPGNWHANREPHITYYMPTGETSKDRYRSEELIVEYIGFVTICATGSLKPSARINRRMTKEQAWDIISNQEYGVQNFAEMINDKCVIVMEGWEYYHLMPLLGYSLKWFQKVAGVAEDEDGCTFYDSVSECQGCNKWDDNDNGYTYNFRFVGECDYYGVNCGCYAEACKDRLDAFIDEPDKAIELSTAEELAESDTLEFVERFIGGWTDGRGGYYDGEPTREGKPEGVLAEYQAKEPDSHFVFSHDESGQFQTYFSIWRVKE